MVTGLQPAMTPTEPGLQPAMTLTESIPYKTC